MKSKIIFVLSVIFLVVWTIRYYTLNKTFLAHNEYLTTNYKLGEKVEINDNMSYNGYYNSGYSITVNKKRIISFEDFLSEYNKEQSDFLIKPEKFLIVETDIENISSDNTQEGVYFQSLPIIGTNWYTFFNREATAYVNDFFDDDTSVSYGVLVHKGTSAKVNIVYNLYEDSFSQSQWDNLDDEPMRLNITIRPVNNMIVINE